ncbi:hypothetical protein G9A89_012603 [Geosiphon pyriformis]|nr:hypothetical protein G9A89_012603 [Geosiphon pyriformis]
MKTGLVLSLFSVLIGSIAATDFNLISPWGETVWKAGDDCTIIWGVLKKGGEAAAPEVTKVNLDLMQGDFNNANLVANIGSNLDVNMGKYLLKNVPDYPAGSDYFVRVGTDAWWRYGHAFTFKGKGSVKSLAKPAYDKKAVALGPDATNVTSSDAVNNSSSPSTNSTSSSTSKDAKDSKDAKPSSDSSDSKSTNVTSSSSSSSSPSSTTSATKTPASAASFTQASSALLDSSFNSSFLPLICGSHPLLPSLRFYKGIPRSDKKKIKTMKFCEKPQSSSLFIIFISLLSINFISTKVNAAPSNDTTSVNTTNSTDPNTVLVSASQNTSVSTNVPSITSSSIAIPTSTPISTSKFANNVIVGYYPDWRMTQLAVNNLYWSKITHINYAYAVLDDQFAPTISFNSAATLSTLIWYAHNYKVQVLLTIGGWNGSQKFSTLVSNPANRAAFISATIAIIKKYDLDGVDIAWEYPGRKSLKCNIINNATDTSDFLILLQELRAALGTGKLITTAVRPEPFDGPNGPIPNVSDFAKVVDWINIMAYDMSVDDNSGQEWIKITGPNAPFQNVPGKGHQLSFTQAATAWLKAGMPASKIVMGVEFIGHSQTALEPMTDNQFVQRDLEVKKGDSDDALFTDPCPNSTPVFSGIWKWQNLRQQGLLKCSMTAGEGWIRNFDNVTQTPWLYNPATKMYISYDDPQSLFVKINYTKKQEFRGIMIWELTSDNGQELLDFVQAIRQDTSIPPTNDCSSSGSLATSGNDGSGSNRSGDSSSDLDGNHKSGNFKRGLIGIIVASLIALSSIGILFWCRRHRLAVTAQKAKNVEFETSIPPMTETVIPMHKHYVIAIYNYEAKEKGDISFKKGDIIEVIERGKDTNDWWLGRINGEIGEFPACKIYNFNSQSTPILEDQCSQYLIQPKLYRGIGWVGFFFAKRNLQFAGASHDGVYKIEINVFLDDGNYNKTNDRLMVYPEYEDIEPEVDGQPSEVDNLNLYVLGPAQAHYINYRRFLNETLVSSWLNTFGIPPIQMNREYFVTSNFNSVPIIGNTVENKYAFISIKLQSTEIDTFTERRNQTILVIFSSLGGAFTFGLGIYTLLFGAFPFKPWGLAQKLPRVRGKVQSKLRKMYGSHGPLPRIPVKSDLTNIRDPTNHVISTDFEGSIQDSLNSLARRQYNIEMFLSEYVVDTDFVDAMDSDNAKGWDNKEIVENV